MTDMLLAFKKPLMCLQVDVEGFEPMVFASAEKVIANGQIDNLMFEYAHGYYAQKK